MVGWAVVGGIERTRPIMKKTKILFTIDDKMDPHWQFVQYYDVESEALADFEDFVKGYHSIYARGYKHDPNVHELWSKNRDEYWFWIMSKPFPKVHAKISTAKE